VSPRREDFIARAAEDGTHSLCLTVGGDLRRPDATDLPRHLPAWCAIAASRDTGIHALDADGALCAIRESGIAVLRTGVDALAEGSEGRLLWTLANGCVAAEPTAGFAAVSEYVRLAAGVADCSAIALDRAGTAWGLRPGRARRRLARGVTEMHQGVGAEHGGAVYLLCDNGDLLRAARGRLGRLAVRRVWDAAAQAAGARAVRLGLAGGWVALLLDDGTVTQGRSEHDRDRRARGVAWATRWRDGPFTALELMERGWTLAARRQDGGVRTGPASPSF
jgi:hypothetical protein